MDMGWIKPQPDWPEPKLEVELEETYTVVHYNPKEMLKATTADQMQRKGSHPSAPVTEFGSARVSFSAEHHGKERAK